MSQLLSLVCKGCLLQEKSHFIFNDEHARPCHGTCYHSICEQCASMPKFHDCPICGEIYSFKLKTINFTASEVQNYFLDRPIEIIRNWWSGETVGTSRCTLCKQSQQHLRICLYCEKERSPNLETALGQDKHPFTMVRPLIGTLREQRQSPEEFRITELTTKSMTRKRQLMLDEIFRKQIHKKIYRSLESHTNRGESSDHGVRSLRDTPMKHHDKHNRSSEHHKGSSIDACLQYEFHADNILELFDFYNRIFCSSCMLELHEMKDETSSNLPSIKNNDPIEFKAYTQWQNDTRKLKVVELKNFDEEVKGLTFPIANNLLWTVINKVKQKDFCKSRFWRLLRTAEVLMHCISLDLQLSQYSVFDYEKDHSSIQRANRVAHTL